MNPRGLFPVGHPSGKLEERKGHLLSSSSGQTESAPFTLASGRGSLHFCELGWQGFNWPCCGRAQSLFFLGLLLLQSWCLLQLLLQNQCLCLGILNYARPTNCHLTSSIICWTMPSLPSPTKKRGWGPNLQHFRIWPHLEIGSLQS